MLTRKVSIGEKVGSCVKSSFPSPLSDTITILVQSKTRQIDGKEQSLPQVPKKAPNDFLTHGIRFLILLQCRNKLSPHSKKK